MNNIIQSKSYDFALDVIKITRSSKADLASQTILRQLIRSSTSVGANVEEAIAGSSKKDFSHKMSIAHKEARESHYWLRLMKDSELLDSHLSDDLIFRSEELIKILFSIVRTSKTN